MEALVAEALQLGSADIAALDASGRARLMVELEAIARRIEAIRADVLTVADRTKEYATDGHRSARSWLMALTNCSPGEATRRDRTSRLIRNWPALGDDLRDAKVGVAQVHELARLGANPRCGDLLPESGGVLLQAAADLPFDDFRIATHRWEQLADSDGAHRDHEASLQRRDVRINEVGGEFEIHGRLPVIHGTILREILGKFAEAEFHADWDAGKQQFGDQMSRDKLDRTAAQRRADALLKLAETAATAGIEGKPVDITVNLVMDQEQFEQSLRNAIDDTPITIDPATVMDRRSETADGVQVDPRFVVALAVMGHVRRVVLDARGILVNAGRRRRLFDKKVADIIKVLEPRCRWLGCTIRAAISQLDHADGYTAGGLTDPANGAVLCRFHNLFKHRNGYLAVRDPGGAWQIRRPDGSPIADAA